MSELRATYRLQLGSRLPFSGACALIPYLRDLGVSHLYLSPSLQARAESTHGYDVVDPRRISEALGGADGFRELAVAVRAAGMGIVLDVVPNHMAAVAENRYWADPSLRARFFDVDPVTGRHRRFFDIDDLAGVRVEDPDVFEETHALVLSLVRDGLVDGLRVDHVDGLADPRGYLERLRARGVENVWVEKILDPGERLRDWPVHGTVGYEFANDLTALFVDPSGEDVLSSLWRSVSGDARGFGEVAHEAKLEQARGTFAPEVERLERIFGELPRTLRGNSPSFAEAVASLPVYRTYVEPETGVVTDQDRAALAGVDPRLRRVLLLEDPAPAELVTRFQQTTPAIMAKGVEDTAFYRYCRLLALNEVGGDPSRFGISVERFHAGCMERAERFPLNLLATSTHDSKRSADVRARIGALASMAGEWASCVGRLLELTERHRTGGAPDDVERYYLFQTLVGAWPISKDRLAEHVVKALREAKRNTSWVEQNAEWEDAVARFARALLDDEAFVNELEPFAARAGAGGDRAALAQLALKLTAPGLPDVYQGDELPFHAVVDPDNRRAVDWRWRRAMLARLMGGSPPDDETRKLFLILRLLGLRARRPEPFAGGGYEPLPAGDDVCAFLRGGDVLVVVAVRPEPADATLTELPRGRWRDVLSGEERSFGRREPAARLVDEHGIGVFEREDLPAGPRWRS